ncbi:hypothetical protein GXW82_08655 [Streptacidiphilus sp. 4-A2]|nr:hypothetical protein [Streptacidiphilus sp. 4-A2]
MALTSLLRAGLLHRFDVPRPGPLLLFSHDYAFNRHIPLLAKIALLVVWYAPAGPPT